MQKAYSRIIWENYPSESTPVNERNLNKMDAAMDELDNRVLAHETTKADLSKLSELFKDAAYDEATGIITFTRYNGAKITLNTKLEKLAINFAYDTANERLVITLDDGTVQYVDMKSLITQFEFLESDTIYFEMQADGKVKAHIKKGSVTAEMLQPNFLADVTVQAGIATQKASEATTQARISTMEADRAKTEADKAAQYSSIVAPDFFVDIETMTLYQKTGVGVEFVVAEGNVLCWKIA